MTISTTTNKAIGLGNGATTNWPFLFIIPAASQLYVYYTDALGNITAIASGLYSVAGLNNPNGGSVTYPLIGPPIATGTSLTVYRQMPYLQLSDITNQGGFYPEVYEAALDYLTMEVQQLVEQLGRAIKTPVTDTTDEVISGTDWASRIGKAIGFNSAGVLTLGLYFAGPDASAQLVDLTLTGNLVVQGNTTLGNAAADTLSITVGTITLGSNYISTRAAGALAAGGTTMTQHEYTCTGDPGGTSDVNGNLQRITSSGGNAFLASRALRADNFHTGTATLATGIGLQASVRANAAGNITQGNAIYGQVLVGSSGNIPTANGVFAQLVLTSTGTITTGSAYLAATPTFTSTGAIASNYGFRASDQGHATLVTTAVGFQADDQTGSVTLTAGFRGQVSSGAGKWNVHMSGTADNAFAGNVRIGSVVAPTVALDVTGSAKVSSLLDLSGAAAGQISFPATQNPSAGANVLDDYEEGTWTPAISSGTGTITTASATGSYTKIGRRWMIDMTITITTNGTGATDLRATLPATSTVASTICGRETALAGKTNTGTVPSGSTFTAIVNYDNTYPGSNGSIHTLGGAFT